MPTCRRFSQSIALFASLLVLMPAAASSAQQQTVTTTTTQGGQQSITTTSAPGGVLQSRPLLAQGSLYQALRTLPLNWDAREKGVLFWVVINREAEPEQLQSRQSFGIVPQPASLPPAPPNGYRIQDIAAHFDRRVISAGSVTVLAPTMTTVLAARLPKPDLYADLSVGDKLHRLEATLTPAQWRILSSPNGLGEADLKPTQKNLFASLLPDSLFLSRTQNVNGKANMVYEAHPTPVSLTPAQRAGMRITLYRTLSWNFTTIETGKRGGGIIGIGMSLPTGPDGTETLSLRNDGFQSWNRPETKLFGTIVKDVVPNTPKPSGLDYASPFLDGAVSLGDAQTVGDLVNRVKQKTGVELYCDPRYRGLMVGTRGGETETVRMGDLLKAVALAVSGTFRRVSDGTTAAYVLTDDAEGLGTRQARISEWAQAATAQRNAEDALVEAALAKTSIGDYVQWRSDDPNAPTTDLARHIEEYRTGTNPPTPNASQNDVTSTGLWVSVTDLPASAQNTVKEQAASWLRSIEEEQKRNNGSDNTFYRAPLRTDRVRINVSTGFAFTIPGVGRVEGGDGMAMSRPQNLLSEVSRRQASVSTSSPPAAARVKPTAAIAPPPFRLTQPGGTVRALLVSVPQTDAEARDLLSVAKSRGFNQLWVETPLGEKAGESLTHLIPVAKENGLGVQAVVRVLRRASGSSPDVPRDFNIIGETMTEWATRRMGGQTPPNTSSDAIQSYETLVQITGLRTALRQKERGDFLDGSSDIGFQRVSADLATLSQTPGLLGIISRDAAAPGSEGSLFANYGNMDGMQSVAADFGYKPAWRLRFLQQTGIDPVDLSPLSDGQISLPYGVGRFYGPPPSVKLPQMPDYGPNAQNHTINGVSATKLGAANGLALWNTFRKEQAEAFWNRLQKTYAASSSAESVPLLRQNGNSEPTGYGSSANVTWIGTWDKAAPPPAAPAPIPAPAAAATPAAKNTPAPLLEKARQTSSRALLTFWFDTANQMRYGAGQSVGGSNPVAPNAGERFASLLGAYLRSYQGGWDGFVMDLGGAPTPMILPLLRGLPVEENTP